MKTVGTLPVIIGNTDGLYEGDLKKYFRVIFLHAQNLFHPYHNFRHMLHVLWLCYQACIFYKDKLTPHDMRNLLIAALFHDFDHCGMSGNDDLNIKRAIRGLEKHLSGYDTTFENTKDIVDIIRATEYPYVIPTEQLSLLQLIIRDADMSQAFSVAWIQQVVFGLAKEWGRSPIDILRMQESFLKGIKFHTEWAQKMFPQDVVDEKIRESLQLLALLVEPAA